MRQSAAPCELCPRRCRAERDAGGRGYCRAGDRVELYRWGRHDGEEPPLSGTCGSGTVFFCRCTLRCRYCQNYPWSQGQAGAAYDTGVLVDALRELRAAGCHNWNLVSPTPWLPWIEEAVAAVRADGPRLPVVYNTSGFERVEILQAVAEWVDIYLTDLRYSRPESADEGSGAAGYVEAARAALREMWRQTGPLEVDGAGVARRGTICRLLILPGRAGETVETLEWLAQTVGTGIPVSVMAQYTPAYEAARSEPWNRTITEEEYGMVVDAVHSLGFDLGWIQEFGRPPPDGLLGFTMAPRPIGRDAG